MESHSLQFSFMGLVCEMEWMTGSQATYWLMIWSRMITNKSGRENITKPHYLASRSTVKHCWWLRSDSREREKKQQQHESTVACKLLNRESSLCAKMSCSPWGRGKTLHGDRSCKHGHSWGLTISLQTLSMDCIATKKFFINQTHSKTLTWNLLKNRPPKMLLSFAEAHSLVMNYRVIT